MFFGRTAAGVLQSKELLALTALPVGRRMNAPLKFLKLVYYEALLPRLSLLLRSYAVVLLLLRCSSEFALL